MENYAVAGRIVEESRRSVTVSGESGATAGNEVYVMKKVLLKLSVFILTVALTGTPVLAASLSDFSDVGSHWASEALGRAVSDGVLNGSGGKLNPDGTLTGAEMAAILVRRTDAQRWSRAYPGTSSADWYYMACAAAMENGILPQDGSIAPGSLVTRAEVFRSFAGAYDFDMETSDLSVLERYTDAQLLSGGDASAAAALTQAGILTGNDRGELGPEKRITRAEFVTMLYRADPMYDSSMKIVLKADHVVPGGDIRASAAFAGVSEPVVCEMQWYLDGKPVAEYHASEKTVAADTTSAFTQKLDFSRYMALSHRVGLGLDYIDDQSGETVRLYTEKTIKVTNYSASYYNQLENQELYNQALNTVSTKYTGNYTSSYNIDYSAAIKQAFVNAKGYSSKTGYLVWTNLATQKVNIFTGSKGDWKLLKTFRCATGARATPTPVGVTHVTYKQAGWYTDSYICKPVVRFYPGTGYAFHSRLYYPDGSGRLKDGAMGYPVSHGCVRMEDIGIKWIYNNIPVNTTVVIY